MNHTARGHNCDSKIKKSYTLQTGCLDTARPSPMCADFRLSPHSPYMAPSPPKVSLKDSQSQAHNLTVMVLETSEQQLTGLRVLGCPDLIEE